MAAQDRQEVQTYGDTTEMWTRWKNPLDSLVKFKLWMGTAQKEVAIPPGGTKTVPSEYDEAIRTTNKAGTVVGGLAPVLVRDGEEPVSIHAAIAESIKQGHLERAIRQRTGIAGRTVESVLREVQIGMMSEQPANGAGPTRTAQSDAAREAARAHAEADAIEAENAELRAALERKEKAAKEREALNAKLAASGLGTPVAPDAAKAKGAKAKGDGEPPAN